MKNKYIKGIGFLLLATILIFIATFFLTSYRPNNQAILSLKDSNDVDVIENDLIIFKPKNISTETGLIIYPGAKVQPESYAPLAHKIAEAGYEVIIVPMPLNFAIFDSNKADKVIEQFPHIKNWVISGHSLGGAMASKYASKNPNIAGILFYASYPIDDKLKNSDIEVTSIYASNDGVVDIEKIFDSKNLLPSNATFIEIQGGNHAQFGNYGKQKGDNDATISVEEQIEITAQTSIELLDKISK